MTAGTSASIFKQDIRGFTLVELAIVMTIIGLLIGGVLKGQEMMQNARINATVSQVQGYVAAVNTFRDRFDNLPGDMPRAQGRIAGCTAAAYCYNGNGNGFVGLTNASSEGLQSGATTSPRIETSMFWKHMVLADLISGVNPGATPTLPIWGQTHPSAPFAGGFDVVYLLGTPSANTGASAKSAHWMRMQNRISGSSIWVGSGSESISPYYAYAIDRKTDDGVALTGNVLSDDQAGGYGACESATVGTYTPGYISTEKRNLCAMFFFVF